MKTSWIIILVTSTIVAARAARADNPYAGGPTNKAAGGSCAGNGTDITAASAKQLKASDGKVSLAAVAYGCGCPTGPVFTLVYEPKTSPLRARVCKDQTRDRCEMACTKTFEWDLSAELKEAGARDVLFVK
jgi:hypothetical protein